MDTKKSFSPQVKFISSNGLYNILFVLLILVQNLQTQEFNFTCSLNSTNLAIILHGNLPLNLYNIVFFSFICSKAVILNNMLFKWKQQIFILSLTLPYWQIFRTSLKIDVLTLEWSICVSQYFWVVWIFLISRDTLTLFI